MERTKFRKKLTRELSKEERTIIKRQFVSEKEKSSNLILYQNRWIITLFNNNLLVTGQYAYPFSFTLPNDLPGTFEYYDTDNTAFIKYLLKARLISSVSGNNDVLGQNILIIRQSPLNFQYPTQLSDTQSVKVWCCFSQGFTTLNVSYPRSHYQPDEKVKVVCSVDNTRCSIRASNLKIQFYQKITLKEPNGYKKFIYRKLAEEQYPGDYRAGHITTKEIEIVMQDQNNPALKHFEKCEHRDLFKEPSQVSKLQASVISEYIECKYYLKVSVVYEDYSMCTHGPFIQIPIIIYIPDVRIDVSLLKPEDWDPVLMPQYILELPTADELGLNQGLLRKPSGRMISEF